jgi:hypothetical protein
MSQDSEPHLNLNQEHEDATFQQSLIPDILYRLRLSVLKDNAGHVDCPSQMFASVLHFLICTVLTDPRLSVHSLFFRRLLVALRASLVVASPPMKFGSRVYLTKVPAALKMEELRI